MAHQSAKLLYCYLRGKWTTLAIEEKAHLDGSGPPFRVYQCLSPDRECEVRQCRLASDALGKVPHARDPWFDE